MKGKNFKIKITQDFLNQIRYLNSIYNKVEWMGIVFFKEKGNILKEDFEIEPFKIFLANEGNSAYVEYNFDSEFIKFKKENNLLNFRYGLIHSHVNMRVFFSGEDIRELENNYKNFDYYFSIITNNFLEFKAKIFMEVKIKAKYFLEIYNKNKVEKEEILEDYIEKEGEIYYENFKDLDFIKKRVEKIKENLKPKSFNKYYKNNFYSHIKKDSDYYKKDFNDYYEEDFNDYYEEDFKKEYWKDYEEDYFLPTYKEQTKLPFKEDISLKDINHKNIFSFLNFYLMLQDLKPLKNTNEILNKYKHLFKNLKFKKYLKETSTLEEKEKNYILNKIKK